MPIVIAFSKIKAKHKEKKNLQFRFLTDFEWHLSARKYRAEPETLGFVKSDSLSNLIELVLLAQLLTVLRHSAEILLSLSA